MVKPSSIQAFTIAATSISVSGFTTTNGYSTRQSVASVTWETRAKPSNWTLSLRVILPSLAKAFLRKASVCLKSSSNAATASRAATISFNTKGLSCERS